MKHVNLVMVLILTSLWTGAAKAERLGEIPVSDGIAEPSSSFTVFENPAGLPSASTELSVQGGYEPDRRKQAGAYGGLTYATGNIGLGAGLQYRKYTEVPRSDSNFNALWGGGFRFSRLSLGLSGDSRLSPSSGTTFTAGLRFALSNALALGAAVYDFTHVSREFGLGAAWGFGNATIACDAISDHEFESYRIIPGIRLATNNVGASFSYQIRMLTQNGTTITGDHFTLGAFVKLNARWALQGYYQGLMKVYAALTLRL